LSSIAVWQICRLLTLQNATHIDAGQTVDVRDTSPIAHQPPDLCELSPIENRGNFVACSQINELVALAEQKRVRVDKKRTGRLVRKTCKGRIDFALGCYIHDRNLLSDGASCRFQCF